jgi:hypothetical protein
MVPTPCGCHRSILAQTYGDYSLISDNASIDGTEQICRAYAKGWRIRYMRRENVGWQTTPLVRMADSPYFSGPHMMMCWHQPAVCVDVLDHDPTVVLASPASMLIDDSRGPTLCG